MLVIISDLHLTDGSTGERISSGAFRLLRERLESMAYDASKRSDGSYKPIEEFDLVILGDGFDLIRSTAWNAENEGAPGFTRPWNDPNSEALINKVAQITDGILIHNAESMEVMRSLADGTGVTLPPATRTGGVNRRVSRDRRSTNRLPVKANIYYMIGNHDWLYHLPGPAYDQIRQKVIDSFGLANPPSPFPHIASESATIQELFLQHKVYAQHGDIHDPYNYVKERGRDYSSIGDVMVIELFNMIPERVKAELGNELSANMYKDLDEMFSVRPMTMTPVWITNLCERYHLNEAQKGKIDEIWDDVTGRLLDVKFLDEMDTFSPFDPVDNIQLFLKITRPLSVKRMADLSPRVTKLFHIHSALSGGGELGFESQAAEEEACKSKDAQYIVYGHTHGYKVYPLRATEKNGKPFDQYYINSGTWHPLHELGNMENEEQQFVSFKTMTYLGFYKDDERKGRSFETWSGTLEV
jgi:UDP-2,3-diacylglucosamine pyrophosphatase LpxH